jgi:hypothetical protein
MDLQIDDFYKDAAGCMLMLYQAFPRRIDLYVEDLIGREEPDEFGLPSKRHQGCLGTFLWLADEGYLRYGSTIGYNAIDQAVLTEKGFLRLSRAAALPADVLAALPPSVRRVRASLAQQLREALASEDSERIARCAQQLFDGPSPAKNEPVGDPDEPS